MSAINKKIALDKTPYIPLKNGSRLALFVFVIN